MYDFTPKTTLKKNICGRSEKKLIFYSTLNRFDIQLKTDTQGNRAGFLASWSAVDSSESDNNTPETDESYVLTIPSSITIGKDSAPQELCLKMFNLKGNGKSD